MNHDNIICVRKSAWIYFNTLATSSEEKQILSQLEILFRQLNVHAR